MAVDFRPFITVLRIVALSCVFTVTVWAQSSEEPRPYWRAIEGGGYLSVAYTQESGGSSDERLYGTRLSWGGWGEDPYQPGISKHIISGFGPFLWLGEMHNERQELWTAGLGADLSFLAWGPLRTTGRFALGASYRDEDPDRGLGAVTSLGLGSAFWLGQRWQALVAADRDFYFPGSNFTRFSVELRWVTGKLPFPLAE